MKIVEYDSKILRMGKFRCSDCQLETKVWKSSGMSDAYPHFYCSDCSNVIHRESDKILVWNEQTEQILKEIVKTLPQCTCGGSFIADSNPKCPNCKSEFKHGNDAIKRLTDPHMILIDGAVNYDENGPKYQVKII